MAQEKMTLASMCNGGVQERIDRSLAKISENILDLNTEPDKKRTLTVQIILTPNADDREDVTVEVKTAVKLAPETGLKTQLFINKDFKSGVTTLTEHTKGAIKGQLTLRRVRYVYEPGGRSCSYGRRTRMRPGHWRGTGRKIAP